MESDRIAVASPERPRLGRAAEASPAPSRRQWVVVSESGVSWIEEVSKHAVMRRTGILARDFRALEPSAWRPPAIITRERAIVVLVEHVRAIITATVVIVPNPKDPLVAPFVRELERRICAEIYGSRSPSPSQEKEISNMCSDGRCSPNLSSPDTVKDKTQSVLPFEFRALELCFESICQSFESETTVLEQEVCKALDVLTSKISTSNLERVRLIKSRLIATLARINKVRSELEHLLDNEIEMSQMYLTDKLNSHRPKEAFELDVLDNDMPELDEEKIEDSKNTAKSSHQTSSCFKPKVEKLEILLEAYFIQTESTFGNLSALREDLDDTMDYINTTLDDKQNRVLHMGVILSTALFVLSSMILMTAIFGFSIPIHLFHTGPTQFWETFTGIIGGGIVIYCAALMWYKRTGILA